MSASGYVHLDVDFIERETEKAFFVHLGEQHDFEKLWIPKSVMADPDNYDVGDTDATISVREWFAEKQELA